LTMTDTDRKREELLKLWLNLFCERLQQNTLEKSLPQPENPMV